SSDSVWTGFFSDDVARRPVKFLQRQGGSMLLAHLRTGDIVMAMASDRIFCSVLDACETLELVHQIGFRLLVIACGLDTGAPGELLMPMVGMMKDLRQRERRRTKEEFEYRKRQGMPAGGKTPIGWEIVRADLDGIDRAFFVPHEGSRHIAQFIAEHYDRWGGNYEQTAYWMNAHKYFRPDGRRWRKNAIRNWYLAAKSDFPLPNGRREAYPIPIGAKPVINGHRRVLRDD